MVSTPPRTPRANRILIYDELGAVQATSGTSVGAVPRCRQLRARARCITCPAVRLCRHDLHGLDSLPSHHLGEFWDTGERQGAQSGHASRISRIAG